MTETFDEALARQLAALRAQGLHRELRRVDSPQGTRLQIGGRRLLNFSSNDYLGLANDPVLKDAAKAAVDRYGVGSGASRLICGSQAPHHELEAVLAAFKHAEAALTFSSGYTAAVGTIGALMGKDDVIVVDRLVHACLVDAARLSGAKLRVFAHNDLADLEHVLQRAGQPISPARHGQRHPRTLVVTESVFSMDGDLAPLREIVTLKEKYGAWLMVDEAHATGLFGAGRSGLAEALGIADRIEVQMGTLGKALGAAGGYICGSRTLIDLLVNRARSFIFSTAPSPIIAAAAWAAIDFVQSPQGQERCARLWARVEQMALLLGALPCSVLRPVSAIIPLILGAEASAVAAAAHLREQGIFIPAIRFPTVPRGQARLRITITAAHTAEDLAQLTAALAQLKPEG